MANVYRDITYMYTHLATVKPPCKSLLEASLHPRYPIRWACGSSGQAFALLTIAMWSTLPDEQATSDPAAVRPIPLYYGLLPVAAWELVGSVFVNPFILGLGTVGHPAHLSGIVLGTAYYFSGLQIWKRARRQMGAVVEEEEDLTKYSVFSVPSGSQ
jgi:membrane associated rhomboid family serine protease